MYEDIVTGAKRANQGDYLLVQFNPEKIDSYEWETELAMWVDNHIDQSNQYYITFHSLNFRQAIHNGLENMAAIKGSKYFNTDPENPYCLNLYIPGIEKASDAYFKIAFYSRHPGGSREGVEEYTFPIA